MLVVFCLLHVEKRIKKKFFYKKKKVCGGGGGGGGWKAFLFSLGVRVTNLKHNQLEQHLTVQKILFALWNRNITWNTSWKLQYFPAERRKLDPIIVFIHIKTRMTSTQIQAGCSCVVTRKVFFLITSISSRSWGEGFCHILAYSPYFPR